MKGSMLEGPCTTEDIGTSVLSLVTRYNSGQREPGGCGTGVVTTTVPVLWSWEWSTGKKIPSKGVTLVTSKRGSLEKNKTGTAEPTVRQKKEAEKEGRSSWALVSIWWGPQ